MKVVVDSNIVFSALLNTQSVIGDILLNSQDRFAFYSCDYLREEIGYLKEKILQRTNYTESDFKEIEYLIYRKLEFVSEAVIPFECWQSAAGYVREIDVNDIAFVALSLHLDIPIWTGDKRLQKGLVVKGFDQCISTQELLSGRNDP